jgi:hypothetical protein
MNHVHEHSEINERKYSDSRRARFVKFEKLINVSYKRVLALLHSFLRKKFITTKKKSFRQPIYKTPRYYYVICHKWMTNFEIIEQDHCIQC